MESKGLHRADAGSRESTVEYIVEQSKISLKSTKSNLEFTLSLYRAITVLHRIIKCLNRIMHSNMDLHRVYTNELWVFTASTYCDNGGAQDVIQALGRTKLEKSPCYCTQALFRPLQWCA